LLTAYSLPLITHSLGDEHRDIEETASCGVWDQLALTWLKAIGTLLPPGYNPPQGSVKKCHGIYLIIYQTPLLKGGKNSALILYFTILVTSRRATADKVAR